MRVKKKRSSIKDFSIFLFLLIKFPVNTSPTRERPSSSHLPSQTEEHSGSGSVQTQFRFQEPVVPEADTTSPVHTRDLSIVQVKWDSERKRRQGYFAQEEGAEKSLFRHYNKANCDFEEWSRSQISSSFHYWGGRLQPSHPPSWWISFFFGIFLHFVKLLYSSNTLHNLACHILCLLRFN